MSNSKQKRFVKKLHFAFIILKFDVKSGFWQIQIHSKDRYKTTFIVLFGQHEWNVMKFWLKNAHFKFQRIMNDIFNSYSKLWIIHIDNVLIFSNSIEQHLQTFTNTLYVAKKNRLVVLKINISLFQTRIHFFGHYIS